MLLSEMRTWRVSSPTMNAPILNEHDLLTAVAKELFEAGGKALELVS